MTAVQLPIHLGVQSAAATHGRHRQWLMTVCQHLTTAVLQVHVGSADQTEKEHAGFQHTAS